MTTATFEDVHDLMSGIVGDEKHAEAATSTADALWVLYDRVLRVTPEMAEDRDRFFLSKGHGPMGYYAVLAAKGFIDPAELRRFASFRSPLGMHPDRLLVPGIEISSGSLGHGLPLAVGTALGLRARAVPADVWVLMGDGELDEGSNHEAIAYAGRICLERLHVIVIDNHSASHGWPGGGPEKRFEVEGWSTTRVNGRDHDALEAAYRAPHPGAPRLVVADTGTR